MLVDDESSKKDEKNLEKLYAKVIKQIDKNNYYLKKYYSLEKKYAVNPGLTTYDMNKFEEKEYVEFDNLLNETYQAVKAKISKEDFKQLTKSELKWLKEVEDYNNVYEAEKFGSIRTLMKFGYEINMRKFRTLLLMLYLTD